MYKLYESSRTKKSGRTSTNLYLQYKWDILDYENHRYNIRTVKSKVDNKAPRTFPHVYYKPKKLQLELERFCAIQKNNKYLMDRLATIQREGGWIDDKNYHEIKSLNTWKRQQEMIELAYNNQALLHRLLECQSRYNHNKLEDEYLLSRKHIANVEKYPNEWRKIKYQMKCMRKRMRERVMSMRTGKGKRKGLTAEDEQAAIEREALEMQKAEEEKRLEMQRKEEEEEKKRLEKSERLEAIKQRRRALADWTEASKQWRRARDERLRLIEERKKEEERKLAEIREREACKERKRREETRKELERWRKLKSENEQLKERDQDRSAKVVPGETTRKTVAKTRKKKSIENQKRETAEEIPTEFSDESSIASKTVCFEGGEKTEEIEKNIVDDLQADIVPSETEKEATEEEEPAKIVVAFGGGQEVEEIEADVVEDLRADVLKKTRGDQDIPKVEEDRMLQTVYFEGGEEAEEVEEEIVEDLRADTTKMAPKEVLSGEKQPTEKVIFEGGEDEEEIEEEIVTDLRENILKEEEISETEDLPLAPSSTEESASTADLEMVRESEVAGDELSGKIIESEEPDVKDLLEKTLNKEITEDESNVSKTAEELSESTETESIVEELVSERIGPTESEEKDFEVALSSVNIPSDNLNVVSKSQVDNESNEHTATSSTQSPITGPTEIEEEDFEQLDEKVISMSKSLSSDNKREEK